MKKKRTPKICRICCSATARQSLGWKTVKGKLIKANVCHDCAQVMKALGTTIYLGPSK